MGTSRLLLGHFNGNKEPTYWEHPNPPKGDFTNQMTRRGLRQRVLEEFDEKVGKIDEMGGKDENQRKMSVFIWNVFK